MTTFYLIRHGENDWAGRKIAGRTPGVHLNARGREQAEQVAEYLQSRAIARIYSSPLERTVETAEPLAKRLGIPIQTRLNLLEIDFGDWMGRAIAELEELEAWRKWNAFRSASRAPNGESMVEVQARMVMEVEGLCRACPNESIALFGHGDPLRSAIAYFLGMPLDLFLRIEMSTASITCFTIDDWSVRFHCINLTLS